MTTMPSDLSHLRPRAVFSADMTPAAIIDTGTTYTGSAVSADNLGRVSGCLVLDVSETGSPTSGELWIEASDSTNSDNDWAAIPGSRVDVSGGVNVRIPLDLEHIGDDVDQVRLCGAFADLVDDTDYFTVDFAAIQGYVD